MALKPVRFVDVSVRDAPQSLWATRITNEMIMPFAGRMDEMGFDWIDLEGGATFDVCVRYLKEDPWERMRLMAERATKTPLNIWTRGQSLFTFEFFPDDIVDLTIRRMAANGMHRHTFYDTLGDVRNIELAIKTTKEVGMHCCAGFSYTLSPVHTVGDQICEAILLHQEVSKEEARARAVDMLATDHAPHQPDEKTDPDIWKCDCGFPGVETAVPLMLTQVNAGRMTINQYVRWSSFNPARAWGLYPRKGAIQAGADADFAIVDLDRAATIDQERLHSKSHIAPWHGHDVKGVPVHTIVRGRVVARDGELVGEPGWGRPVPQQMPPAAPRNVDKTSAAIVRPPLAAE